MVNVSRWILSGISPRRFSISESTAFNFRRQSRVSLILKGFKWLIENILAMNKDCIGLANPLQDEFSPLGLQKEVVSSE